MSLRKTTFLSIVIYLLVVFPSKTNQIHADDRELIHVTAHRARIRFWRKLQCLHRLCTLSPQNPTPQLWLSELISDRIMKVWIENGRDDSVVNTLFSPSISLIRSAHQEDPVNIIHPALFSILHELRFTGPIFRGGEMSAIHDLRNLGVPVIEQTRKLGCHRFEDIEAGRLDHLQEPTLSMTKLRKRLSFRQKIRDGHLNRDLLWSILPSWVSPTQLHYENSELEFRRRGRALQYFLYTSAEVNPYYFSLLTEEFPAHPSDLEVFTKPVVSPPQTISDSTDLTEADSIEQQVFLGQRPSHYFRTSIALWRDKLQNLWHIGFSLRKGPPIE